MATTPNRPTTAAFLVRHSATHYTEAAENLVRDLRAMADRVERALRPEETASIIGTPRYSYAVEQALNGIAWDEANAQAARLIGAAARADAAEAAVAAEQAASQPESETP